MHPNKNIRFYKVKQLQTVWKNKHVNMRNSGKGCGGELTLLDPFKYKILKI